MAFPQGILLDEGVEFMGREKAVPLGQAGSQRLCFVPQPDIAAVESTQAIEYSVKTWRHRERDV
jgi:hypothetical protein